MSEEEYSDFETEVTDSDNECIPPSRDQQSVRYLNAENYSAAVSVLEELIAESPEEHFRYPRLASAYVAIAGVDLLIC